MTRPVACLKALTHRVSPSLKGLGLEHMKDIPTGDVSGLSIRNGRGVATKTPLQKLDIRFNVIKTILPGASGC